MDLKKAKFLSNFSQIAAFMKKWGKKLRFHSFRIRAHANLMRLQSQMNSGMSLKLDSFDLTTILRVWSKTRYFRKQTQKL